MNPIHRILLSLILFCNAAQAYSTRDCQPKPRSVLCIDGSKRVSGRMASTGYLRGKIVMLADFDFADPSLLDEFRRLQEIWSAFKSKNFVLIGSYRGASKKKASDLLSGNNITFPVYEDVELSQGTPSKRGIYVFDMAGNAVYSGFNSKHARASAGAHILSSRVYTSADSYKKHVDLFLEILPGKALNVLKRFKKDFPSEFGQYEHVYRKLAANENIVKLAKLENVCRQALDYDPLSRRGKKPLTSARIDEVIGFYGFLTTNKVEVVAQEAKNCIAELKWLQATL